MCKEKENEEKQEIPISHIFPWLSEKDYTFVEIKSVKQDKDLVE